MGAHNALGARLAERAGFDGVWASGLEVSASYGVPDADILTMSELLAVAQSMTRSIQIPILADCDTGYGNAINVINTVKRYEEAHIGGICMEDKVFPKVNSFIAGRQQLTPVQEFGRKISAAKSAQVSSDFVVVARTETLIAGGSMGEALDRAEAYAEAGADAVLIHDKSKSPDLVLEFVERWSRATPVVVVPTTYYSVPFEQLVEAGVKLVIYANHGLRASIRAMENTFKAILESGSSEQIEDNIASLAEVFGLQGVDAMKLDESRFVDAPPLSRV